MVARAQQIRDPSTKHPGNEITDSDDSFVALALLLTIVFQFSIMLWLFFLGGSNMIH